MMENDYEKLRQAAMEMQVIVGSILAMGGTDISSWWENLIEAQQRLAAQTKGNQSEFEKIRADKKIVY